MAATENFIRVYDEAIPADFCRQVIERFEEDPNKISGLVTSNQGNVANARKQTTEMLINRAEWADVTKFLKDNLLTYIRKYEKDVKFLAGCENTGFKSEIFRLKKYQPEQYFTWHIDCSSYSTWPRVLAVQWYFNSVSKGGHTEFETQHLKIKPVEGRLVFFPVSWMYRHRGAPPISEPKYICTNFLMPLFD